MVVRTLLPIPTEKDVDFVYDPHDDVAELMNVIKRVAEGASGAGIIIGGYGFGKTHVMLHLAKQVRNNYDSSIIIYINTPGSSFMNLYRAFINSIIEKKELLTKLVGKINNPLKEAISLIVNNGDDAEYARQWLLGEQTPQNFRLRHGLGSRVNEELALRVMIELSRMIVSVGYGPILILIDELEDIITIGQMRKLQYLSLLRNLIDNLPSRSFLLASSTPAGWDEIVNTYPALARRLSTIVIYLRPFTYEETQVFINQLMKWRDLNMRLGDDVVKVIHEYTEGNPGEIVRALSLIYASLGENADANRVKELLSRHV